MPCTAKKLADTVLPHIYHGAAGCADIPFSLDFDSNYTAGGEQIGTDADVSGEFASKIFGIVGVIEDVSGFVLRGVPQTTDYAKAQGYKVQLFRGGGANASLDEMTAGSVAAANFNSRVYIRGV